ncbi:hypothetical protein CF15_01285 [Pyrodictium occultum]|uniref:Coenzyme F420:L-glutamate ligase-like domain-containing protein n=1 Tax=Pyrodictium occultum TaxID=2309 RepID=A0A0V8RTX3_PYROC|nr:coenzyme F420-0:L-glutamate ligase [Pyrodictium occultum]KSW11504.1 hypothetical protein CF15_01285 [Pyrodictium occultum]
MPRAVLCGLPLPEVEPGDDLAALIAGAAERECGGLRAGDVVAVASKVLSKSLGLLYRLDKVEPSPRARRIAERAGLDPRYVEILLRESGEVLAAIPFKRLVEEGVVAWETLARSREKLFRALDQFPTIFLTKRDGMLWTDSGIDGSNHPPGVYSVPPRDLDGHARRLSEQLSRAAGGPVAVVICDTEVMPGGALDIARGAYGFPVLMRRFGDPDRYGKPKFGGADNLANAVCASASLLAGQHAEGIPAVILRGLRYEWSTAGVRDALGKTRAAAAVRATLWHTARVLGLRSLLRLLRGA